MDIKIIRLSLENFKCHRNLTLLPEGRSVSVYGDNATGKTSIYDALTWLLFGKDSLGNGEKNIDIKPLDRNGEVRDHQAITSVEAEFSVNGEPKTFKRTYREVWTTKRGSGEAVYDGNTSDYFVDGVPCKKNAFDSAIKELVSEDLFRMLTSVSWFAAGMKWQYRRAVLFDMAGTMTDKEIMAGCPQFAPLLDGMGKLGLEEYKSKLLHKRKGLTGIREDAPTRINECQRTVQSLESIDFTAAREEERALTAKRDSIQAQLLETEKDSALESKRMQLREAKVDRDLLEGRNMAHRESQKPREDSSYLHVTLSAERRGLASNEAALLREQDSISQYDTEIQHSREQYIRVSGEAFTGGVCPTCGQQLPFEQLQEATRTFSTRKEVRLSEIVEKANRLKAQKQLAENRVAEIGQEIAQRKSRIQELEDQLRASKSETIVISDLPEYASGIAEITRRIDALQRDISGLMADSSQVRERLRAELNAVNGQLRTVQGNLAKEDMLRYSRERIAELKEETRKAAAELEEVEKMLFLMEEFTRYKARFVEASVNDLFRVATFRLFREQANGGLEERCDVVYGGVPFMGLNNGARVNVGIDIINALSRHYGVTVPLFVDNAEAVTRLEACQAQVIRLVVSEEDKELRIV